MQFEAQGGDFRRRTTGTAEKIAERSNKEVRQLHKAYMKRIVDLPAKKLNGLRVLVRSELNVETEALARSDFRLRKAITTISYLRENGAKVIVCAHVGRKPEDSLAPISRSLKPLLPHTFLRSVVGPEVKMAVDAMVPGDVLLLENLRQHPGEVENSAEFAEELASYADLYVNDALSVANRKHASIVGVPTYIPSYAVILFAD
mgnify:CR=1 FL=1